MRTTAFHGTSALLTFVLVTSSARSAWADCANDSECKGDRVCERGQCVSPSPKTAPLPPAAPPAGAPLPPPQAVPPPPPAGVVPPAGPPPGAVRVDIEGKRNDHVSLEGPSGRGECRAPCTLMVPPGRYELRGRGFNQEVDIPN